MSILSVIELEALQHCIAGIGINSVHYLWAADSPYFGESRCVAGMLLGRVLCVTHGSGRGRTSPRFFSGIGEFLLGKTFKLI